jgi:site-specific DNA-methyltransferase (adenine-specific)
MAFASSRGWHRLAVAIEDAGLRIHPSIFGWAFGSGFPKATRVGKNGDHPEFAGHRYGLQAMKPALEPIIVFQKPYKGKPVDSIVETGAGALNIDGARIAGDVPQTVHGVSSRQGEVYGKYRDEPEPSIVHPQGRWSANFYLDEEAARRLGKQSGHLTSGAHTGELATEKKNQVYGHFNKANINAFQASEGTAARFFFNVNRQLDAADPVLYQAKATRKERDAGLGDFAETEGGIKNASGRGYSERDPYAKIKVRNPHPTVKPIDLTRWLATLLLPPTEYAPRRILIPFSGSGSEMIGAHLAGWEQIVGIEMAQEYCEIAEARLKYWTTQPKQLTLIGVNDD